ncbi:amidohydrolase family protein [Alsobacter sp. R-9]
MKAAAPRLVIRAGRLVDGRGGAPLDGAAVLVEGERIVAAGRAADVGLPDGATVIDAPGKTLIPGLIDAHVHLAYSGIPHKRAFRAELVEMSYPAIALRAAAYARNSLRRGFTALRDMHAPGGTIIDLRRAIDAGHVEGPRIKACGRGLSVTGGHMDQPGWADHTEFRDLTRPCDGPVAFRQGVREEIKRGADFIKLNTCVSYWRTPGVWCRQEMTNEEIAAACDEAHMQGYTVAAHTSGDEGLANTIIQGVDCVEHAHFCDERIIELMVKHGTYYVPTLLVNERNFDFTPEEQGVSPGAWRWLNAAREAKWTSLAMARKAGVRICSGTDAGFMLEHGPVNWKELALLVQGGLTPLEAITAATATNADLLGIEAGRIVSGKLADLVLVDGDPTADIAVLGDVGRLQVFKGGRLVA